MKASTNSTLAATLIATAAGIGAWFFGLAKANWQPIRKLPPSSLLLWSA